MSEQKPHKPIQPKPEQKPLHQPQVPPTKPLKEGEEQKRHIPPPPLKPKEEK